MDQEETERWQGLSEEVLGCIGSGKIDQTGIESIFKMPSSVLACMNALRHYLSQFNLQQVRFFRSARRKKYIPKFITTFFVNKKGHFQDGCHFQVLLLTGNLWKFASGSHMTIDASVLENLEVARYVLHPAPGRIGDQEVSPHRKGANHPPTHLRGGGWSGCRA